MESKPHKRTALVLKIMQVLTWIAFIGLMVEAGAILFSYTITCFNPGAAKNLYKGLNLYDLRQFNLFHYSVYAMLLVLVPALKAVMCYYIIKVLAVVNIEKPFKAEVAALLEKISYSMLAVWIVSVLTRSQSEYLFKLHGFKYDEQILSEYLFVAGMVFIISQVFRRGTEIQHENELTV